MVGAPTLEQFKTSYNAVNTDVTKQLHISGYKLRFGDSGDYVYEAEFPANINKEGLYVTGNSYCGGVWLSSYSTYSDDLMYVHKWGELLSCEYDTKTSNINMGLRPLIKLKSGVKLVDLDSDGVYDLQ